MSVRFARIVLGVLGLYAISSAANDDFDTLLVEALSTHPAIESRRAAHDAARFDREGSEWQKYPSPSIEAFRRNSDIDSSLGRNSTILALEQPLWTGGRISAGIRAAGYRQAAAQAAVAESGQAIGLRLISAFIEVLRHRDRRDYARASVEEHERLLALIRRRVQQEVSTPADRDFAQARLAQALTELSLAEQNLNVAQVQLSQLVGRPVALVRPVRMAGRSIPGTLENALTGAIERSPVLLRLEQESLAAGEEINLRRAAVQPQLAVRIERQMGTLQDSRAMLVLRAQPGAGLSAVSAISAAQRRHDEVRMAMEEAQRGVREQVQVVFSEWRAAEARLASARQSSGMTQAVFESYSRQYVAGRKTWIDVLNAVREVSQSQYILADADALMQASMLRLWLLAGESPTVAGEKTP